MRKILSVLLLSLFFIAFSVFAHDHKHEGPEPDAHLKFSNGKIHDHVFWEVGPKNGQGSVLRMEFMNGESHSPTEINQELSVSLWMPDMDHGSSAAKIEKIPKNTKGHSQVGIYRVSNLDFTMAGHWEVRVNLKNADGKTDTQIIKVEIKDDESSGKH